MKHKLWSKILFWLHFPIVLFWFGLFLVPLSFWPGRITFHFWYIISIMFIQLLWSVLIFKKIDIICPLTTWMQYLRGFPLKNKENYDHSYIAELLNRLHLRISYWLVNILLAVTLIIVIVQYVWLG